MIKHSGHSASPLIQFGLSEVQHAVFTKHFSGIKIKTKVDPGLETQSYTLHPNKAFEIIGGDEIGVMYGLLELAEQILFADNPKSISAKQGKPFLKNRGLKFNIPLDARTPSYDDTGDAALRNISEMWNLNFWVEFLDAMARYRYNTLTLWNPHPFPHLVKLPKFPKVALNDVFVPNIESANQNGQWKDAYCYHRNTAHRLQKVKHITIEEKIIFWKQVMRHAKQRGIKIYFITWNINMNGVSPVAEKEYHGQKVIMGNRVGPYGINNDQDNDNTITYLRACIREFALTYPDLAGIGITPSENMVDRDDEYDREKWLYNTYGKGVEDAKKIRPELNVELIHRVWLSGIDKIMDDFVLPYPDSVSLSFKYAKARLYSSPTPAFADDYLKLLEKHQIKSWWNLRNDDIFHFRWGDANYVRAFLKNLPGEKFTQGYFMGSDGYVWGREHIAKYPKTPRELEIDKHWFRFMLWGRLGYDIDLTNDHFIQLLAHKYPNLDAHTFYEAWSSASKIVPLVNRFHWRNWDHYWAVEGCFSSERNKGFNTIFDFIHCPTMEGQGILNIPDFTSRIKNKQAIKEQTPLDIAVSLEFYARRTLQLVEDFATNQLPVSACETLKDMEAFAYLGLYYADKIRGANALHFAINDLQKENQRSAVEYLKLAAKNWDNYAAAASSQYFPQELARTQTLNWHQLKEKVAQDIELTKVFEGKSWTPIFNGLNLDGWHLCSKPEDEQRDYFYVEDSILYVDSRGNTTHDYMWLLSDSAYCNFTLTLEFQIISQDGHGNSGVQFRSRYDTLSNWLDGPQVDICPNPLWRSGMIWDETRENLRWLSPNLPADKWVEESMKPSDFFIKTSENDYTWGVWNRLIIVAEGGNVKVYLNDQLVNNYDGEAVLFDPTHQKYGVGKTGHFAIQLHKNHALKIAYRNIYLARHTDK